MEEIIKLIDAYWRFDKYQMPMSSWHDKQDLIEAVRKAGKNFVQPYIMGSCQHDWVYSHCRNVNDYYVCAKCGKMQVGNLP